MSTHSVSAMTGLKAPKRRAKGAAKAADPKVSDLATALGAGQAVLDATVRLANALQVSRAPASRPAGAKAPVKAAAFKSSSPKSSSKPSSGKGAVTAKGWRPAKVTDGPDIFQGTGDTVDD